MITAQPKQPCTRCCECDAPIGVDQTCGWSIDFGRFYCRRCYWSEVEPPPPPPRRVPVLSIEEWELAILGKIAANNQHAGPALTALHALVTDPSSDLDGLFAPPTIRR